MTKADRRPTRRWIAAALLFATLPPAALLAASAWRQAATAPAATGETSPSEQLAALGSEDFATREAATTALLKLGPPIAAALRERLAVEPDAEIRHRIRFLLDTIVPPDQAVLVLNADPASGLEPGDLIVHVASWRIRNGSELRAVLGERALGQEGVTLRVSGVSGTRDVPLVSRELLHSFCDYAAPNGARVRSILRNYVEGRAEDAAAELHELAADLPQEQFPALARARVLAVAGRASEALQLLAATPDVVAAPDENTVNRWLSPSPLDLALPGRAPYAISWELWGQRPRGVQDSSDPDLRTQRVLVPAGRFADALLASAEHWSEQFRTRLESATDNAQPTTAGNMLAVMAWMLFELGLQSECQRLIEPRSIILRATPQAAQDKWMRVQTDAWLPFFQGDAARAVQVLYEPALNILQAPVRFGPNQLVIRNPAIAAQIAFFTLRAQDAPKSNALVAAVAHRDHPGLASFAAWSALAADAERSDAVCTALDALLPHTDPVDLPQVVRYRALLEYAAPQPRPGVFHSLSDRLAAPLAARDREAAAALLDVLAPLSAGKLDEAARAIPAMQDAPGAAVLQHTIAFLKALPEIAQPPAALDRPLLCVPIGQDDATWLIVARDTRVYVYERGPNEATALDPPTPGWFPGPRNFPWIGREPASGRVWAYGVRRVIEFGSDATPDAVALRVNIADGDIAAFDAILGPHFSALAAAVRAREPAAPDAEDGEYLRSELRANLEFTTDPDLPELSVLRPAAADARLVHVAFRGGPTLLIDRAAGKLLSSTAIAAALSLPAEPEFYVAAPPADGDSPPMALLLSSQGVLRYRGASGEVDRIALPDAPPHGPIVPESAPYVRRDPRWVYFARGVTEGGKVYRIDLRTNAIEALDMQNISVAAEHYAMRPRSELRRRLDERLEAAGVLPLEALIADATLTVDRWNKKQAGQ